MKDDITFPVMGIATVILLCALHIDILSVGCIRPWISLKFAHQPCSVPITSFYLKCAVILYGLLTKCASPLTWSHVYYDIFMLYFISVYYILIK